MIVFAIMAQAIQYPRAFALLVATHATLAFAGFWAGKLFMLALVSLIR